MSIIQLLSCVSGITGNDPNKKLACSIAESGNSEAVKELVENLKNKNKTIQSDCIDTLYEVGYRNPELIADYFDEFLQLLKSKNNRLVWGGMIALATIADLKHKELFNVLDIIMQTVDNGSVITIDNGVNILIKLTKYPNYFNTTNPLLMEQLLKCPIKQLPMYSERAVECITEKNKMEFIHILENRFSECERESQSKRLDKVLKKIK